MIIQFEHILSAEYGRSRVLCLSALGRSTTHPRFPLSVSMPGRERLPRPKISAPFGPVKTSRGLDLQRSEKFVLVNGIQDCTSATQVVSPVPSSLAQKRARRISASFRASKLPAASPVTVASEVKSITKTEICQHESKLKDCRKPSLLSLSVMPLFRTSATFLSLSATQVAAKEDGSSASSDSAESDGTIPAVPRLPSKLPKSRTMNVLHELKKSISRQALRPRNHNADLIRSLPPQQCSSATKPRSSEPNVVIPATPDSKPSFVCHSAKSTSPELDIRKVNTAQPSAYWSGRFMALQDRFSCDHLEED